MELSRRGISLPLRVFISGTGAPSASDSDEWKVLLSNEPNALEKSRNLLREWNGTPEELLADTDSLEFIRSNVAYDLSVVDYLSKEYINDKL